MNKLIRMVTAQHLVIIGLVLIVVGNSFSATFLNIRVHELIASLGALFLIVATLQWFFDENSREQLVQQIIGRVGDYLNRRDNLAEHGIASCLINSKDIADDRWQAELIGARTLAIGVQYSDGTIVRYERVIRERVARSKETQIAHSQTGGISQRYLETCLANPVNLEEKLRQFTQVIRTRFNDSPHVRLVSHDRVLRYSFVYSERAVWIIFSTNTDSYQPRVPALRINSGSPLFEFFKDDIARLGIAT